MTRQEAMEAARVFLSEQYPTAPPTIVLREEWTEEHAWAWRVVFDTQEYLDTRDIRERPMSRALYVRKDSGEVAFVPTAMSTEVSNRYLETGIWPFGPQGGASSGQPSGQGSPYDRARAWLHELYGPVVELATPAPVAETAQAWWYAVRPLAQPGYPATPMLNASLVVPKDGSVPFHPGNADPWATSWHLPVTRVRANATTGNTGSTRAAASWPWTRGSAAPPPRRCRGIRHMRRRAGGAV
jgi:hypothetical protein